MITSESEANERIVEFTAKYGNGKVGLTELQKKARKEKILASESNKIVGLGEDQKTGIDFFEEKVVLSGEEKDFNYDKFPENIKNNFAKFPKDIRSAEPDKNRILNVKAKDNGAMEIEGIVINGNEMDVKKRATYGVLICSDRDLALIEKECFEKKKLKEVSDRTMVIHQENNDLKQFLDDPEINTDPDRENQI